MCLRLKQNDPDVVFLTIGEEEDESDVSDYVDDTKLALLERSLDGNTNLETLWLKFLRQPGSPLTKLGAEAFAFGISHSHINNLDLSFDSSKTFQQALFLGLRQCHRLVYWRT
jgi:hypothetical protein